MFPSRTTPPKLLWEKPKDRRSPSEDLLIQKLKIQIGRNLASLPGPVSNPEIVLKAAVDLVEQTPDAVIRTSKSKQTLLQEQTIIAPSANIASRAAFPRSTTEPKFMPIWTFDLGSLLYE